MIIQIVICFSFLKHPDVIQLKEYTNLVCPSKKNDDIKVQVIEWFKSYKNNTHVYMDSIKFKKFNIDDIKILQIKNMNEDDKKFIFTCVYFYSEYVLTTYTFENLNPETFINPLSSDNINIEYVVNNMNLKKININFRKIFPIPKCFIKIKNEFIFPKNFIQTKTINYLYYQVNLNMKIENINCFNKIKIICNLLNIDFVIDTKNNTCINNNLQYLITIIINILFLIYISILIIFIYFIKKLSKQKK